jgi:thiol-disulfide isomerase/thioredoxin
MLGFQSWCPGCHSRGFPTLKQLIEDYKTADDVAFVAVQTVFEGYSTNTTQRAWDTARQYKLDIPVGHDGSDGRRSTIMRRYRTGGTPWVIIIDKKGVVRFNDFHVEVRRAHAIIDRLRAQPAAAASIEGLPAERGGQDLVGQRFREPAFDRWLDDAADRPAKPGVTLYRWWTDTCPYCRASLPAIETLRREYGPRGLDVVGVYHPKPARFVDDDDVRRMARQLGFGGRIAVDNDWSALRRAYLSTGDRRATSVTFLVDAEGVIRFLHPGPVFFPSDDPDFTIENDDYRKLKSAITILLREQHKEESHPKEHSR